MPGDIDILLLPGRNYSSNSPVDSEPIKQFIVARDSCFSLDKSTVPSATYTRLYYTCPLDRNQRIKVDIVSWNCDLNFPSFPYQAFVSHQRGHKRIPLLAIFPLFLLKLKGWKGRQHDPRPHLRAKVKTDLEDIKQLLPKMCACAEAKCNCLYLRLALPNWFIEEAKGHFTSLARAHPEVITRSSTADKMWEAMGLLALDMAPHEHFSCPLHSAGRSYETHRWRVHIVGTGKLVTDSWNQSALSVLKEVQKNINLRPMAELRAAHPVYGVPPRPIAFQSNVIGQNGNEQGKPGIIIRWATAQDARLFYNYYHWQTMFHGTRVEWLGESRD